MARSPVILLFLACAAAVPAAAESPFEAIFNQRFAALRAEDAPTVLEAAGIEVTYNVIELPTRDDRAWTWDGTGRRERSATEQLRQLPTTEHAAELLALSGLDMREILGAEALRAAGDRAAMVALLAKYIEPRMDKHNRKSLEGYDPALCLNATRDRVYRLDVPERDLDAIRASVKLFHAGRHADYRAELEKWLAKYPGLSYLHVAIGNSHFAEGDLARAEQWYRQGATANPLNPMLGYSMAFCRLAEGDAPRAIEALTGSVIACRNNMLAWLALECLLPGQGGVARDHRFRNRVIVAPVVAHITVDKVGTQHVLEPWLHYGAAELVTAHERSRTEKGFDTWDLEAIEYYKVAHLLGMYLVQKSRDPDTADATLEFMLSVLEAGYLPQYVLYEKIAPYTQYHRVAALPEPDRARMREYIDRYVIQWRRPGAGPVAGPGNGG